MEKAQGISLEKTDINIQNNVIANRRSQMTDIVCRLANIGYWSVDTTTLQVEWSEEVFHIYDMEQYDEPTWSNMISLLQGTSQVKFEQAIQNANERVKAFELILEIVSFTNRRKWIRCIGNPVKEEDFVVRIDGVMQDITELMETMTQEKQKEHNLESFFDVIPDMYFSLDLEGTILDYRASKKSYLYAPPEQFLNKRIRDVLPPEISELFVQSIGVAGDENDVVSFEYDLMLADGNHHFECRISLLNNQQRCVAIVRDITEQYLATKALAASELRYRHLLEEAPFPTVIVRREDGKLLYSNQRAKAHYGFTDVKEIDMPMSSFYHNQEDRQKFLERLLREGSVRDQEMQMVDLKGELSWVLMSASLMEFENEQVIVAAINDITARKETEEALRVSEEKYRALTEYTSDVIWVLNLTTSKFSYISPSIQQLRGYTAEEAMLQTLEESLSTDSIKVVKEGIVSGMQEFIQNPNEAKHYITEIQQPCKDGQLVWVEVSTKYRFNAQNELEVFGVSRNIEQRKKMEQEVLYLSYHDQLTGLYNRRFYEEQLQKCDTEENLPITLVVADVNGLKLTNDAFGHLVGDKLLTTLSKVLMQECRENDVVARVGGDEFVILLPRTDSVMAEQIVKRIKAAIVKKKADKVNLSVSFGWKTKEYVDQDFNGIYKLAEDDMYRHKLFEGKSFKDKTLKLITNMLYEKFPEEKLHGERVSELCKAIGRELQLSENDINELGALGLLHDIGKIGVDEAIMNKQNELSEDEWRAVKRHPEIGYQILRSVSEFAGIAEAVLAHHEREDGKGYPKGIHGSLIPLMAKILSIATAYDSMINPHIYENAVTVEEAIREIKKNAGTQFNIEIAKVFVEKVLKQKWD